MRIVLISMALLAAACAPRSAMVRGHEMARPTVAYSDHRVFALIHDAAYPEARGPSSGLREYAGRMAGRVCGNDVWLEADYRGRFMEVGGFYEPNDGSLHTINQVHLEVRDYAGERHIRGSIGAGQEPVIGWAGKIAGPSGHGAGRTMGDLAVNEGDHVIDLSYNSGLLHGMLNGQRFMLALRGDDTFEGTVTAGDVTRPFTLRDVSALWSMPAADQAAVLPMLLACRLDGHANMPADGHLDLTGSLSLQDSRLHR
jgi:hypothetical protein